MVNHGMSPQELNIIRTILQPYKEVYVFGSRVKGTHKPFSDLDICIKQPIPDYQVELLNEQFTESDLPFKVDVVLYNEVDDSFKKRINQEAVALAEFK